MGSIYLRCGRAKDCISKWKELGYTRERIFHICQHYKWHLELSNSGTCNKDICAVGNPFDKTLKGCSCKPETKEPILLLTDKDFMI